MTDVLIFKGEVEMMSIAFLAIVVSIANLIWSKNFMDKDKKDG